MPSSPALSAFQNYVMTETYLEVLPVIRSLVNKFHHQYGFPKDDLMTVAHRSFVRATLRYDRAKGMAYSNWIGRKLWGDLMDYTRTESRHRRFHCSLDAIEDESHVMLSRTQPDRFMVDLEDRLSDEARVVVSIVLEPPEKLSAKCHWRDVEKPHVFRHALRDYLSEIGWHASQIKSTFQELMHVLKPAKTIKCQEIEDDKIRKRVRAARMKGQDPVLRNLEIRRETIRFLTHD